MVVGSRISRALKGAGAGYWMVLPALLAILAIVAYPLAFATYYSFRRVLPNLAGEFIGLENYSMMLEDPDFAEALKTTLLFTAASTSLSFLAGLGLALLLSKPFWGRGALAAAAFLPWVFPPVVVATFGRLALFSGIGPVSRVAEAFGYGDGELLLLDHGAVLSVAVLVDAWRAAPFVALLVLAALRTIPEDIYEAARVDGAGALQRFFYITLPLLKPALLAVLLIRLLDAFRVFDLFRVLGKQNLTSLSTYVYQDVMLSMVYFGLGNAAAVFVFLCAFLASLFFALVLRSQASTGLANSGLQRDAARDEGAAVSGRGYGRSGLALGAIGWMLSVLFLAPLAWVFWAGVPHSPGAVTGPALLSYLSYPMVLLDTSLMWLLEVPLANSAIIAGSTAALTLVLACPAAYALARFGLPYSNGLLSIMLAVAFFPPVALLVPLLVQLRASGLVDTQLAAIIPDTVFFLPLAIWLLANFFKELPAEVEDAAKVDGAGQLRMLTSVIAPLAAPSLFATGAFVFVLSWNELIFASTFTISEHVRPVTVVLSDLVAQARMGLGPLASGSLVAALPPVVLFLAFRRRILAGLTGGDTLGVAVASNTSRAPAATPQRVLLLAATAIFMLAGAWAASLFVRHGLAALAFPFPLNYGEGPLLDQAARLADLKNIYHADLSKPPYVVSNYPPLFVLLQAPLVWIFGPGFWYGRAISLASTIAVAALIALTVHVLTRDKIASASSGLTFLAVPFVLHWSSLDRVDMLGLALSWGGLYAVVRRPDRRGVILAALLMVAAIYTRQTYALAAPLAAFAWLLAGGQGRRALALATLSGGLSLLLLGVFSALTGGGFFFHTVTANANEFRWDQVSFHLYTIRGLMPLLLVGGLAFVVLGLRSRTASWWLVGAYLGGSAAATLLIGKVGSDVNYLLELSGALSLAAGTLIARYSSRPGARCALLLALAVQVATMVQASQGFYAGFQQGVIDQRSSLVRLEALVDGSKGPVLADEYAGLLPLDGRRIYLQPFEMTQLQRDGRWDQGPLLESIERRKFPVILIWKPPYAAGIEQERWTREMLEAIEENYEPVQKHVETVVYRPRDGVP